MSFNSFHNVPFKEIPEENRVKKTELAICQGGCNSIKSIANTTYQLCGNCGDKWRYHGYSCDVPNCESVADGSMVFQQKENKMLCKNCCQSWGIMKLCVWERFVEQRHLYFLRPETFVKALAEGLVAPVENPVKWKETAECHGCHREALIYNIEYQLCDTCVPQLQFHGEMCSIKGSEPCTNLAIIFDTQESRFVCRSCVKIKSKYNLTSYAIYESQIRTITECTICSKSVSHNPPEGKYHSTAFIDHDHETGIIRGILCHYCNASEGNIKKTGMCPEEWGRRLIDYYEAPPLAQSWTQNSLAKPSLKTSVVETVGLSDSLSEPIRGESVAGGSLQTATAVDAFKTPNETL